MLVRKAEEGRALPGTAHLGTGVQGPPRAGPLAVADQDPRPSDALTLVTSVYNGTMPDVLKNVIDWRSRPRSAPAP
ncbi:NAD(P)H-dependent oxidoreductase [Streptomyces prunicolor]|uniref:NAD(P)H-dependent oxidoreductase n=1 Tax=Streptomyces prunicolor TaxID=67348 RepID=UPI00039C5463